MTDDREAKVYSVPLEPIITPGWAIVDTSGRVWADTVFGTEDAATKTAAACGLTGHRIVRAKRVSWDSRKPTNKSLTEHEQILIEGQPGYSRPSAANGEEKSS